MARTNTPPERFNKRGYRKHIGKNAPARSVSQLHLERLRVPNPFNDWLEQNSIDICALAIATGIRTYRLHSLRTGVVLPHYHEAIVIERASAGGFSVGAWAKQPAVAATLQRYAENAGKPTSTWMEGRWNNGIYLQPQVRAYMREFCEKWLELQAAEQPAEPSLPAGDSQ